MKVATPQKTRGQSESSRPESVWDEIRIRLERRRDEILERIGGYPTPIPACDVDFNRLLEERARVFEELDRLERLRGADKSRRGNSYAINEFLASCTSLREDERCALRAMVQKT